MDSRDNAISHRIQMLRFLMIAGVVVLHVPHYVPIAEVGNDVFSLVKAFFQHAVFRGSVPVLTFISGYLLFIAGPELNYRKVWGKKCKTLGVPFLIFNLGLLGVAYGAQRTFGIASSIDLLDAGAMVWANAAFGLTDSPINYPLNFLRDLMVIILMAPAFGLFLRRAPIAGLVLVAYIFMFNIDGRLILRADMPVVFYAGALAAVRKWDMRALDKYACLCLLAFAALCAYVVAFRVANTNVLRFAAPLLVWPAASLLVATPVGRWMIGMSRYSFFVFVAHAPVLLATSIVYKRYQLHVPYEVYWIATPVVTVAILTASYKVLARFVPEAFGIAVGTKNIRRRQPDAAVPARIAGGLD